MPTTFTEEKLTALGITEEVTTCECCGKVNLKCTVYLSNEMYVGRDCAGMMLKGQKSPKNTRLVVKEAELEMMRARDIAGFKAQIAIMEGWQAEGFDRYLLGGMPKGALLSELLPNYRRDLAYAENREGRWKA